MPPINGYLHSTTVQNINVVGIDTVVFHSSADDIVAQVLFLTSLPTSVSTVLYVNKAPDSLLTMVMTGIDAIIYDDESYLVDTESLNFLVEAGGDLGTEVKTPTNDMQTLETFISKLGNPNEAEVLRLLSSKGWFATLNNAVNSVKTSIVRADESSTKVVEFVDNIQEHIQVLEKRNEETGREIAKLRERVQSLNVKAPAPLSTGSLLSYGTYDVSSIIKNVIYVRTFGDIRYLTTFFLMFQNYLASSKRVNINANMLIVKPQLTNYVERYSSFCRISPVDAQMLDTSQTNVFVTFEPQKKVLDTFFNAGADAYFVLDFLQAKESLLRGCGVKTFGAYASPKLYETVANKTPLNRSFFSIEGVANSDCYAIAHIDGFPLMDDTSRKSAYFKNCKELYNKLTEVLIKF